MPVRQLNSLAEDAVECKMIVGVASFCFVLFTALSDYRRVLCNVTSLSPSRTFSTCQMVSLDTYLGREWACCRLLFSTDVCNVMGFFISYVTNDI